jgi:hypothetical protein
MERISVVVKRPGRFVNERLQQDILNAMRARKLSVLGVCTYLAREGLYLTPQAFHDIFAGRVKPTSVRPATRKIFLEALGIDLYDY